ncbi:hypothetical protein TNCV_737111 [Trichonephila clavipes]|nr:hypothetical protein TNCV_737111 [Trichonephila clavipes]
MSSRHTSRTSQYSVAGSLRMSEPLTLEAAERIWNVKRGLFNRVELTWIHKRAVNFILHPPWSLTREAVCRSIGNSPARRLSRVHPGYSTPASGSFACVLKGQKKEREKWMTRWSVEKKRRITRVPRGRDTRIYQRQYISWEKEKITRAPRDCDTHTHLKKSPPRGKSTRNPSLHKNVAFKINF